MDDRADAHSEQDPQPHAAEDVLGLLEGGIDPLGQRGHVPVGAQRTHLRREHHGLDPTSEVEAREDPTDHQGQHTAGRHIDRRDMPAELVTDHDRGDLDQRGGDQERQRDRQRDARGNETDERGIELHEQNGVTTPRTTASTNPTNRPRPCR